MRLGEIVLVLIAFLSAAVLVPLASTNKWAGVTEEAGGIIYGLSVKWTAISNPSQGEDHINSVCYLNGAIYVVGYSSSTQGTEIRVEKRSAASGDLLAFKTFSYEGNPVTTDCVAFYSRIYLTNYFTVDQDNQVIDKSTVLILDENLELIKTVELNNIGVMAVENDESFLYLAGLIREGNSISFNWVLIKLSPDGEVVADNTFIMGGLSIPTGLKYDSHHQQMWLIGGKEKQPGDIGWTILRVSPSTLSAVEIIYVDYPFYPHAVAVDYDGYAYVTGSGGTVKISPSGELLIRMDGLEGIKMILHPEGFLVMGITTYGLRTQSLIKLLTLDFEEVASLDLGANIELNAGKAATDGFNIYFAGDYASESDVSWIIYSAALVKTEATTSPSPTQSLTETQTGTVTITETVTTTVIRIETTTVTETVEKTVTSYTPIAYTTTETLTETVTTTIQNAITLTRTNTLTTTIVSYITSTETVTEEKTFTTTETSTTPVTVEKAPYWLPVVISVLTVTTLAAFSSSMYLYYLIRKGRKK